MPPASPHSLLFIGNYMDNRLGSRAVSEDLSVQLEALGCHVVRASRKRNKLLRLADMLATAWSNRANYDVAVLDVFSGSAFRFAEAVASMMTVLGKPFVLILHGGNLPQFAAAHPSRVRRLLHQAAAVVAPSRYLQEKMSVYRPELQLIPNPISLSSCSFVPRRRVAPELVWLRAYHRVYNLPMAIAVADRLRGMFPDFRLTVVGPDKGDGTLAAAKEEVARLELQQHVRLLGPVPKNDVPDFLNRADIFLNTTNFDNTPVSVLEAMACGLCVVSTNVGGIPYLLDDGEDSLLVPPGDVEACVQAITRILTDESLAARISAGARCKAESFDWSCVLPEWQRLLQNLRPSNSAPQSLVSRPTAGH